MDASEKDNPFGSPQTAEVTDITRESVMRYGRVGWMVPLIGVASCFQWLFMTGVRLNFVFLVGVLVVCGVSLFFGIRCTIYAFVLREHNPPVSKHIRWAVMANLFLGVVTIAALTGLCLIEWPVIDYWNL